MSASTELSTLLLPLYGAARAGELDDHAFKEQVLTLIKPRLRFDSAVWGEASLVPNLGFRSAHLHEEDPRAVGEWLGLLKHDKIVPAGINNLGTSLQYRNATLFSAREDREILEYTKRWKHTILIATANFFYPGSDRLVWTSLYRRADREYSAREIKLCEVLMAHATQSLYLHRIMRSAFDLALGSSDFEPKTGALIGDNGRIQFAGSLFLALISLEWPEADDLALPRPLIESIALTKHGQYVGRRVYCSFRRSYEVTIINVRMRSPLDDLSPKRKLVSVLYVSGHSYKYIARTLGISTATVRNHIRDIDSELGVHRKADLIALAMSTSIGGSSKNYG